jgi:hypothetical protein
MRKQAVSVSKCGLKVGFDNPPSAHALPDLQVCYPHRKAKKKWIIEYLLQTKAKAFSTCFRFML